MKKIILSVCMSVALLTSFSAMAQEKAEKATCTKAKTECPKDAKACDKKDAKACCKKDAKACDKKEAKACCDKKDAKATTTKATK